MQDLDAHLDHLWSRIEVDADAVPLPRRAATTGSSSGGSSGSSTLPNNHSNHHYHQQQLVLSPSAQEHRGQPGLGRSPSPSPEWAGDLGPCPLPLNGKVNAFRLLDHSLSNRVFIAVSQCFCLRISDAEAREWVAHHVGALGGVRGCTRPAACPLIVAQGLVDQPDHRDCFAIISNDEVVRACLFCLFVCFKKKICSECCSSAVFGIEEICGVTSFCRHPVPQAGTCSANEPLF